MYTVVLNVEEHVEEVVALLLSSLLHYQGIQRSLHNHGLICLGRYCTKNLFITIINLYNVSSNSICIFNIKSTNIPIVTISNVCPFIGAILLHMSKSLAAVALDFRGAAHGRGGHNRFCCSTRRHQGLVVVVTYDAEGVVLRVPLVKEGVNIHTPEEGDALATPVAVVVRRCCSSAIGDPAILFLPT
jgi:hypothetical protein